MGGSSKTSTHATTSTTPQVPSWVSQPFQNYYGNVGRISQSPQDYMTPATANQTQAWGATGQADPGMGTFQNLTGWEGQQVDPSLIAGSDLSQYMNPFQQQVTDATLGQFQQGNALGLNQLRGSTPTGAFNGSRQGVAEGQLTGDNMRTLASTLAGLNSANFANAQGAAGQDAASKNQAKYANQSAAQAAAATRLAGAGAASDASRAHIAQQMTAGQQEHDQNAADNPNIANLDLQRFIQSLLGQNAAMYAGSRGTADQTTKQSTTPGIGDILGTLMQVASMGMGGVPNPFKGISDRRLKRDTALLGQDEHGNRWWEYRYVWDAPGVKRVGVMADEVPEHCRIMEADGFYAVDYSKLPGVAECQL